MIEQTLVVVGRHSDGDVRLDSHRVSRWHCVLTRAAGAVVVRDLGSRNGTWINGRRVASAAIAEDPDPDPSFTRYSPFLGGLGALDGASKDQIG